jgi:hypothetical protein
VSVYFDSSVITKWYLPERDSAEALRVRDQFSPPSVLTHLHRVELTTAWYLKVFRKELAAATVDQALADLAEDVREGVWQPPRYDLGGVYTGAETLARQQAIRLGVRTLDILHVAAALALGARDFVTNDDRQGRLARTVGLNVVRLRA